MRRRTFLQTIAVAAGLGAAGCRTAAPTPATGTIQTVLGPIRPAAMGLTLPHEHVLVDFIGADQVSPDRYDRDAAYAVIRPHLEQARALGCRTLVECTPAYLGRDPTLLRDLAEATGLHLLTNTGYYGARQDQHLPPHAFTESADALAARWVREAREGIDGTDVRPGFMKIGVDGEALSEVDRKLIRAAARTHLQTGLTIATHTGPAVAAFDALAVLAQEGVDPSAWIWVHAQAEPDLDRHIAAGRQGAWVEFDGLRPDTLSRHLDLVQHMKANGLLHRVLVSHDAGWYHVGEPGGGTYRPYDTLFDAFLPALREAGFTDADVHRLTVLNPATAFTIGVRAA